MGALRGTVCVVCVCLEKEREGGRESVCVYDLTVEPL